MTDDRDDVSDRLARRFDTDDTDDDSSEAKSEQRAGNDKNSQNAMNARNGKRVENVKDEWKAKTVYLPENVDSELSKTFKRLDLELDDELTSFRKTRHFYPLLVAVGMERLESMERAELMEQLESLDPDLNEYVTE
jgi:hypothetical protein